MSESIIRLRTLILCEMNTYILNEIGDEEIFEIWFLYGLSDEATMDDIIETAKNDKSWVDCIECFAKCCKVAGVIE